MGSGSRGSWNYTQIVTNKSSSDIIALVKVLIIFLILTFSGYIIGSLTGFNAISHTHFSTFSTIALALGLYVAVSGIDLPSLGKYKKTAWFIITAGVPLQIFVTGFLMWVIYPHPVSLLVAVAIDQIDPLSVTTLLNNKAGMSKEAKTLLRVWASFDDPVTVLVGFVFLIPIVTGVAMESTSTYLIGLIMNVIPALGIWWAYKKEYLKNWNVQFMLLVLGLVYAVATQAFLFAAIMGLFIRPFAEEHLSKIISVLYYSILIIVGAGLVHYGIDIRLGFLLALVEFFVVQPLSALTMVKGTTNDIFRLAFAQQNGLTTILMGLAFQTMGFNVLPILLPAIVVINILNLSINGYYSWKESQGELVTKADPRILKKYKDNLAIQ